MNCIVCGKTVTDNVFPIHPGCASERGVTAEAASPVYNKEGRLDQRYFDREGTALPA